MIISLKSEGYDAGNRITSITKLTIGDQEITEIDFSTANQTLKISKSILDANKGDINISVYIVNVKRDVSVVDSTSATIIQAHQINFSSNEVELVVTSTQYESDYRIYNPTSVTIGGKKVDYTFDINTQTFKFTLDDFEKNAGKIEIVASSANEVDLTNADGFVNKYKEFYENGQKLSTIVSHNSFSDLQMCVNKGKYRAAKITKIEEVVSTGEANHVTMHFVSDDAEQVGSAKLILGSSEDDIRNSILTLGTNTFKWKLSNNTINYDSVNEVSTLVKHMSINSDGYMTEFYSSTDNVGYKATLNSKRTKKTSVKLSDKCKETFTNGMRTTINYYAGDNKIEVTSEVFDWSGTAYTQATATLAEVQLVCSVDTGTEGPVITFNEKERSGIAFEHSGEIIIEDITK